MLKQISLIILYLLVISALISYVVYEEEGVNIDSLQTTSYSGDFVDFSGNIDLDALTTYDIFDSFYWSNIDNTLVYNYTGIAVDVEPIYFKGIKENDDGNYDVEYQFNNINNLNFDIYITQGGILNSESYILSYEDNEVIIYYPYTHSTIGSIFKETMYTKSFDLSGEHTIRTVINENTQKLTVYIDDVIILDTYTDINNSYVYYGGIYINDDGKFTLSKVITTIYLTYEDNSSFLSLMAQILVWNVDEDYLPLFANIILIKFPMIVLGIAVAFYARGTQ